MNRYEDYIRQQFKKLDNTIYGFGIVISDGNGNLFDEHVSANTPN